ncbi:hypothetical protein TruAng_006713 [Truncatella angustata]|nr:hypothetical protein TruAng_006713 [Truncatella angustata]
MMAATACTYVACTPPHPNSGKPTQTNDFISTLNLTQKHNIKILLAPLCILALHSSILALFYPHIPPGILGYGAENGPNTDLLTWSAATTIPLALILLAGVPLRLISYSSLGKNFTFALTKPDRLTTTGIHRYLQHPSYTGVVILIVCNIALFARADGVASCWFPQEWVRFCQAVRPTSIILGLSMLAFAVWRRVQEEEDMLRSEFGAEWEKWHARTARFIPWVI